MGLTVVDLVLIFCGCHVNCEWSFRGDLPRDELGRSAGGHLQRRCRSEGFSQDAGRGVSKDRVRGACLLSDGQSLSSGGGDAGGKLGGGNALVLERLYDPVQPPTQADRTRVQRTLQVALVEGGGAGYLRTVCDYVHLNPVRARLLGWRGVPKRDAGANGRRLKRASLWTIAAGECGCAGGADHRGGTQARRMERYGVGRAPQERSVQSGTDGAVEAGDDVDDRVDCRASENGNEEERNNTASAI